MISIRVPTPLRAYTEGAKEVAVEAHTVGEALRELAATHTGLRAHLFDESGELRSYVNLYLNQEDVRHLDGAETTLSEEDELMIVPSIAGGSEATQSPSPEAMVDHAALRVNQAAIISLLLLAFIFDISSLVVLVSLVMLSGSLVRRPGFLPIYRLLSRIGLVKSDRIPDHPQPHRFAQTLGGAFLALSSLMLLLGRMWLGWGLAWLVVGLAALNLFGGFCVGCALYYRMSRLGIPGFNQAPPPGTIPGRRPESGKQRA
jgi:molybdopterin converting factor small subunit